MGKRKQREEKQGMALGFIGVLLIIVGILIVYLPKEVTPTILGFAGCFAGPGALLCLISNSIK